MFLFIAKIEFTLLSYILNGILLKIAIQANQSVQMFRMGTLDNQTFGRAIFSQALVIEEKSIYL
jgi:hypothetical protein